MFASMIFAAAIAATASLYQTSAPVAPPVAPAPDRLPPEMFKRPVPPHGDLAGLFTADDYPAQAIFKDEEGAVGVEVAIDEQGRVTDCIVATSSGSAALDAQTCRIFFKRGRFEPAQDEMGNPVASAVRQRIRWLLQGETRISASSEWIARYVISMSDGRPLSCTFEFSGDLGLEEAEQPECQLSDIPPFDQAAYPGVRGAIETVIAETRLIPGEVADSDMAAPESGDILLMRRFVRIAISPDGKLSECRELDREGLVEPPPQTACNFVPGRFRPPAGDQGKSVPVAATMVFSTYARVKA